MENVLVHFLLRGRIAGEKKHPSLVHTVVFGTILPGWFKIKCWNSTTSSMVLFVTVWIIWILDILSQKIEHGSIFCDRLRSRSQDRRRSQTIAEVCFHSDRRQSQNFLRSAICVVCDHLETSLKEGTVGWGEKNMKTLKDLNSFELSEMPGPKKDTE